MAYKKFSNLNREKAMIQSFILVKKMGVKQSDVAKEFGCSQSTISQWAKEVNLQENNKNISNYIEKEWKESEIISNKIKKYRDE